MSVTTYQQIRARLEAEYPDLWRKFNPRIYTGVDGWGSSAVLAAHMAATIECLQVLPEKALTPHRACTGGAATSAAKHTELGDWNEEQSGSSRH